MLDSAGVEYILHGGSLLGAYRHGMQVPWDDDMDIYIMNDVPTVNNLKMKFKKEDIIIRWPRAVKSFFCSRSVSLGNS